MDTITPENIRELFTYNPISGELRWKHNNGSGIYAGDLIKSIDSDGYSNVCVKRKKYKAHRVAWLYHYGKWPIVNIDHLDGERLNNKINNLREATVTENNQNQECHRLGKYPGISERKKNTFLVKKSLEGTVVWIGTFNTLESAIAAWKSSTSLERALAVKEESKSTSKGYTSRDGGKTFEAVISIKNRDIYLGARSDENEIKNIVSYARKMRKILLESGADISKIKKSHLLEETDSSLP